MDNFTLAVVIGDIAILAMFGLLILLDSKSKASPTAEPAKPAGKRPA